MPEQKVKVGLVGAGHICEFHVRGLRRLQHVEILGVTDLARDRAHDAARRLELPAVYGSLEEMIAAGAEVVHVLTPPASHAAITLRALELGCHVFVEKPLATSVHDCDEIAEAARKYGRIVGVDHSQLREPLIMQALRRIERGEIGTVEAVDCFRSQDYPPYIGGPLPPHYRDGGFPFRDLGIHSLYLLELFLGNIEGVSARYQHRGSDPLLQFDDWRVAVQCERGTAQIHISWNVRPLQDWILIQGTRGVMRVDRFGMYISCKRQSRLPEHPRRAFNAIREGWQSMTQTPMNLMRVVGKRFLRYHGLQQMIAEYYDHLRTGRPEIVTAEDARRMVHWLEKIGLQADRDKERFLSQFVQEPSARILVTGATGFIGQYVVRRLLEEGERIRIIVRREPPAWLRDHPRVEVMYGDLGDSDAVSRAVEGTELVFHVGGTVSGGPADYERGNVAATKNVVAAAQLWDVRRLVYVSSLSVLQAAGTRKGQLIREDWPLEAYPQLRGHYTQTKLAAEQIVRKAIEQEGLRAVILRPGEVVGAGAPLLSSGVAPRLKNRLVMFGDGASNVPLVDVEDLTDAILAAADEAAPLGSTYHLVDAEQVTQNEIAEAYIAAVDRDLSIMHVPRLVVYAGALMVQILCRLLGRPAPLSIYRVRSALAPRRFDCALAMRELGWQPQRGARSGLAKALGRLDTVPALVRRAARTEPLEAEPDVASAASP